MTEPGKADLAALLEDCWDALRKGAEEKDHPFHIMVLATSGLDGRARARSVILRGVAPDARELTFFSDARSPKVAELERDPRAALLFYDPAEETQLRLEGLAAPHPDAGEEERAWRSASRYSRRTYLQVAAPGRPAGALTSGLPPEAEGREPSEEELLAARGNFRLLRFRLLSLDWLKLGRKGQSRACWSWDEEGAIAATFLVP